MRIICCQSTDFVLTIIKRKFAAMFTDVEAIEYTDDPTTVADLIPPDEPCLVVVGNQFKAHYFGRAAANMVKEKNPNAIVVMFAQDPQTSKDIDGVLLNDGKMETIRLLAVLMAGFERDLGMETIRMHFWDIFTH